MKSLTGILTTAVLLTTFAVAQERAPAAPAPTPAPERGVVAARPAVRAKFARPVFGRGMGAWWKNSETIKQLNITDAQRKQLEQTFMDYRMKLIDLRADAERQELKLQPLMDADQVDENAISQQLDAVIASRGRLEKAHAMMNVNMRKVLTVEQWKKLEEQSRHIRFFPHDAVAPIGGPGAFIRRHGPEPMLPRMPLPPPGMDD